MKARRISERGLDHARSYRLRAEEKFAKDEFPLASLPKSDPMVLISEYVSLIAGEARSEIEKLPQLLAAQLPSIFGLSPSLASPARAFIQVEPKAQCGEAFTLPAEVAFRLRSDEREFVFCSKEAELIADYGSIEYRHEGSQFFLSLDRLPERHNPKLFFELEAVSHSIQGKWEMLNDQTWQRVSVSDQTKNFTQNAFIQFFVSNLKTQVVDFGGRSAFWFRFTPSGRLSAPIRRALCNVVRAENLRKLSDHCLGSGDASPSQRLALPEGQPTRPFRLKAFDAERAHFEIWEQVESFLLSASDARHYLYDYPSGSLVFGDAHRGRCLPPGYDNVWLEGLELCDGAQANLPKNSQVELIEEDWRIGSLRLVEDCSGGSDQQQAANQLARLHTLLRTKSRAVSAYDFESLALEASPRVGKAFATRMGQALKLSVLNLPAYSVNAKELDYSPDPSDLQAIQIFFEDKKPLNQKLIVGAPRYRDFDLSASIFLRRIEEAAIERVENQIRELFCPYHSLEMIDGRVQISEERIIESIEKFTLVLGVKSFQLLERNTKTRARSLELPAGEFPRLFLNVNYEERLA